MAAPLIRISLGNEYSVPMAKPVIVSVDIAAPLSKVWNEAADLASHAEWMADAEKIDFLTEARSGVGTRMAVETKVGPLTTTDIIEVTEWVEPKTIGVIHSGVVTGTGAFMIEPLDAATTRFTWREELDLPWFFGGPLGATVARPIFGWIWRRNLGRLKQRLEQPPA